MKNSGAPPPREQQRVRGLPRPPGDDPPLGRAQQRALNQRKITDHGDEMSTEETQYALEATTFHSMREAQELADILEENLRDRGMGARQRAPRTRGGVLRARQQRRRARHDG